MKIKCECGKVVRLVPGVETKCLSCGRYTFLVRRTLGKAKYSSRDSISGDLSACEEFIKAKFQIVNGVAGAGDK